LSTAQKGRELQRNSTRDALVQAGAKAFAAHGLDGVRIALVAKAAGVANGTFYLYFKNKDELFHEVVNRLADDLAQRVTRVHETYEKDAPDEGDRAEVEAFVEFVEEYPGIIGVFWADGPNGRPMNVLSAQREEELRRMVSDDTVRDDIDLSVTARCETYLLLGTLCWWDETHTITREVLIASLSEFRREGTRRPAAGQPR
jgi:AcrR family transcriptional regulator